MYQIFYKPFVTMAWKLKAWWSLESDFAQK